MKHLFHFFIVVLFVFSINKTSYANWYDNLKTSLFGDSDKESQRGNYDKYENLESHTFYPAGLDWGLVGVSPERLIDNPSDNVFHIALENKPNVHQKVWLVYDLKGVKNHQGISRGINDELSLGGQLVKTSKEWTAQKEQIHPLWLKQGDNVVRFSLPETADYNFEVQNLGLLVENEASSSSASTDIVVDKNPAIYGEHAYVKGFITGQLANGVTIYAGHKSAKVINGAFELILDRADFEANNPPKATLSACFSDGTTLEQTVTFKQKLHLDFYNKISNKSKVTKTLYQPEETASIHFEGATLEFPCDALSQKDIISIRTLRSTDIPALDQGMVNVTGKSDAFRFLPHGSKFEKEVQLKLTYDPTKIPDGYTEQDIKTYYFDEESHHWVPLRRDSILTESKEVLSRTDHFTDMINGIIKVPESPVSQAYTPTSIKDIKAANPSAAVNFIQPPSASNKGNANLGFNLALPAGRNGLQPSLGMQYSNGGGNDWMGLGWNMQLPSVSLDTRWGAPRFDANDETETYLLNGQQLGPVAHRVAYQPRTSEKQFYPRVEGAFNKIIRHGNSPANYWWEVTAKNGVKSFYGGLPSSGVQNDAVLRGVDGDIAHWALVETRDPHDNFVRYHYGKINDVGISGGTQMGKQLYIERITYTGHGTTEGKYSVHFTRDRELGEPKRVDVQISGRNGFKQVTADLLRKVEVKYDNQNIRSYSLNYTTGAFYKTLLAHVTEYDSDGNPFTSHTFDYYDDVRNGSTYQPYASSESWTPQNDGVEGNIINPLNGFDGDVSCLSGTESENSSVGLAVTVGVFDLDLTTKLFTAGGHFSSSSSSSKGLLTMVDINGDGLQDKVFLSNEGFSYRANQSGTTPNTAFGPLRSIMGVNKFYREKSRGSSAGFEAHFGIFVGLSRTRTTSTTSVYFTDVNGDQLVDVIINSQAFFNHLNANGDPVFTASSADTPSPINQGGNIDGDIVQIDSLEFEESIDQNPLHDVVRVWQAPYDGVVTANAPVRLIEDTSPDRQDYTAADGVRVTVQHNGTELWSQTIAQNDYSPKLPAGLNSLLVSKGDRIYFRVQSIFDGAWDQVEWNPTISYNGHTVAEVGANNLPDYQFNASDDFVLSAAQSTAIPIDGQIKIESTFSKPVTSDDVTVEIIKESGGTTTSVWQQTYAWNAAINAPITFIDNVLASDVFSFKVTTSSNVDWVAINWQPRLFYTASSDPQYPTVTDNQGNPMLEFYPVAHYSIFAEPLVVTPIWETTDEDTVQLWPRLEFLGTSSGEVTFTVKKLNELVDKQTLTVTNGIVAPTVPMELIYTLGEEYYFEYHIEDRALADALVVQELELTSTYPTNIDTVGTGLFTHTNEFLFGPMYRGWGQFAWNGNRNRASEPIDESLLILDPALANPPNIDFSNANTAQDLEDAYNNQGGFNPANSQFIMLFPSGRDQRWMGYDELTYVGATTISSSRMGADDISIINPIGTAGTGARGIVKVSKSSVTSFSIGGGTGPISGSLSQSEGTSRVISDFMDMNGDRYPDIVTSSHVQYTEAFGALCASGTSHGKGDNHKTSTSSTGVTLGGNFVLSKASTGGGQRNIKAISFDAGNGASAAGISGNFGESTDEANFSWNDVNGDGLPDRVYKGGMVGLNLGYAFLPPEPWGYYQIREGEANSEGGGLGINIGNNSIAAGISVSRSDNEVNAQLQDVNGDGLLDEVSLSGSQVNVRLNTGNGFGPVLNWSGINAISENSSTSESANLAFTVCIPIFPPFPVAEICINPQGSVGQGVSRELKTIKDVDGDGYPDFLRSSKDSELTVSRSKIGRTNMLRSVQRPLGASFTLDYERVGNTYEMPHDAWVLKKVLLHDGFDGDGADSTLTTFAYEDGYYDRHEREFYGFKTVKSYQHDTQNGDNLYRQVVQTYLNDNYYENGLLASEELLDAAGNKYTETRNTYQLKDIQSGANLPNSSKSNDAGMAFVALAETEKLFYEGQATAGKSTKSTYQYDLYGNISGFTDFGEADPADDYYTAITYHTLTGNYIMDVPLSVTVSGGGNIFRKQETSVNAGTGDVTQIRQFLDASTAATYDFTFDTYGNLLTVTRPENSAGQRLVYTYEYDTEVHTYSTKVSDSYGYSSEAIYDYRFGQVLESTSINGQQMQYVLDALGRTTQITGPYELASGAPYTIRFEYHHDATIPWASTQHYDPEHPNNPIETYTFMDGLGRAIQVKKDGAIFTGSGIDDEEKLIVSGRVLFDAFGRSTHAYYPVTEAKGQENTFNDNFDGIAPTSSTYDVLDRVVTATLPDNAVTTTEYGFGNDRSGVQQFMTRMTDANGISKEQFKDVRGRQTAMKDFLSGTAIWTSFEYNAINELVAVKDDHENLTTYQFDWLGRQISRDHPDAGLTEQTYDLANNVISKVTANLRQDGLAISYTYDHERITDITYPINAQNNVHYEYGEAGAPDNRAGRLLTQEDASGKQEFYYGPLGEIVKNERTIQIPGKDPITFTFEWEYDTWNRIQRMVYSDGEEVTYNYNHGGKLESLSGLMAGTTYNYLTQLGYDKFEQRVYLSYGNGTETNYQYEPDRRRLQNMVAETSSDRVMMDNAYSYDAVTNILQITNSAPVPAANLMGGPSQQSFVYDDLYRLISATGSWEGSSHEHRYTFDMEYNTVHDILQKTQTHDRRASGTTNWVEQSKTTYDQSYTYGGDQPHAATQVGDKAYSFDLNGNQTGWEHDNNGTRREITWDEEDRMQGLADNGQQHNYIYDANGERVLKGSGNDLQVYVNGAPAGGGSGQIGNYTIYVNPFAVVRSGQFTKHFYIESQRIVSKLGESGNGGSSTNGDIADNGNGGNSGSSPSNPNAGSDNNNAGGNGAGNGTAEGNGNGGGGNGSDQEAFQFYFHPDHLGSSSYITDAAGEVYQHVEYFPFGETFAEEHSNTNRTPYLYNGKELDGETGLYYYGARYYDPEVSRWLSVDPLADKYPSYSPYNYVTNNPITYVDPDGREPVPFKTIREPWQWHYGTIGFKPFEIEIHDSKTFNLASIYNTKNLKSSAYQSVFQRRLYYTWASKYHKKKGHEVRWIAAAKDIVEDLEMALRGGKIGNIFSFGYLGSNSRINAFIKKGNRLIFQNVMKRIKKLGDGGILKGEAAKSWDAQTLSNEQNVAQPLYDSMLKSKDIDILNNNAGLFYGGWESGWSVTKPAHRWALGMREMGYKNTKPEDMPKPTN